MFKKPVDAKALQRLSGADKKKLRRTAKERFPQASDADIDAIIPPKVSFIRHIPLYKLLDSPQSIWNYTRAFKFLLKPNITAQFDVPTVFTGNWVPEPVVYLMVSAQILIRSSIGFHSICINNCENFCYWTMIPYQSINLNPSITAKLHFTCKLVKIFFFLFATLSQTVWQAIISLL